MKESFQESTENLNESDSKKTPQFIKEFSRENSQEERDATAAAIRERRRERDNWRNRHNESLEGKENIELELENLQKQVATYGEESFMGKIKDYFAYRNAKAQIEEQLGALDNIESNINQEESEKPEFREAKTLLKNFYDGETKKWAEAGHTPEDLEKYFSQENLAKLPVEEYVLLMKRFPGEMLTHVTRQGIRDHASSIWHTAGVGAFSNGFKEMLEGGRLKSSLGIALQEHNKEDAMAKFLHLDKVESREDAINMYKSKFEQNIATGDAFADGASVHLASENVMDYMYGSERGNEIFMAFPSAHIASQMRYGGKGNLTDKMMSEHNDKWVYTKDQEGMLIDAGLVFIPEDAMIDPKTGSKYKMSEQGMPIIPKQRINEILTARFENKGFVQEFVQRLPYRMSKATEQERAEVAKIAFAEFKITDTEAQKALLNQNLIDELSHIWGKEDEKQKYEEILNKYFHKNAENPYELAEDAISSKEYWEKYFQENPEKRPSKIIYYSGGDPSRALNKWREENGIVKRTEDSTYGFPEHNVRADSQEANEGKDRFSSLALKVIDDRFPEVKPHGI